MEFITKCGGSYSNSSAILASPNFPNTYPELADCVYIISQPKGTYLNISFLSMDIKCEDISSTSDYIEIRDGNSEDSPLLGLFCGNNSNVQNFMTTSQNYLRIR